MTQCGMSRSEAIADPWDLRLGDAGVHGPDGSHRSQRPVRIQRRERGQVGQHFDLRVGSGSSGVQVTYPQGQQHDPVVAVPAQVLLEHDVNDQRRIGLTDTAGSPVPRRPNRRRSCSATVVTARVLRRRTRPGVRP